MANGSFIQVTNGAGPKVATGATYTDETGSNTVQDQKFILGEPYMSTFTVVASGYSGTTSGKHLLQIMAGASLNVRIKEIVVKQLAPSTSSAGGIDIQFLRLSSAGTGGGAVTPRPMDPTDTIGATAMTLPTANGTEGGIMWDEGLWLATAAASSPVPIFWDAETNGKPIIIPKGTANGLAIKTLTGFPASATITISVRGVETTF